MVSNNQRHLDKEKILLRWLLFFDYTNRKIIAELFKTTDGALSQFYRSMQRKNLISIVPNPNASANQKLIVFTQDGFDLSITINDDIDINKVKLKRSIPPTIVRHQLALQMYLVKSNIDAYSVVSDKLIRKRTEVLKFVPDAIALINNERVAIEMELTRKKPSRVIYKYQLQAQAMRQTDNKRTLFDRVIFVFDNESLMNTYKKHFDEPRWDYCVLENHKVYIKHKAQSEFAFILDENFRSKFSFVMNE